MEYKRMNILEYIEWCMSEHGMTEEEASICADMEYNLNEE